MKFKYSFDDTGDGNPASTPASIPPVDTSPGAMPPPPLGLPEDEEGGDE